MLPDELLDLLGIPAKRKRKVFYSFHYKDNWRVAKVRNMGVLEGNEPASDNDWEEVKDGGDRKIKKWIDDQMFRKSCVVVLVGQYTASRRWVKYEIKKAWDDGKGVVGIHIHKLTDSNKKQAVKGENPFEKIKVGKDNDKLSTIVKCYDVRKTDSKDAYNAIKSKLAGWIEDAIKIRNDY